MLPLRNKLFITGIAISLAATMSACSSSVPDSSPTIATVSEQPTETPAPDTTESSPKRLDISVNTETGVILSEEVRKDKYGSYRPLALAPDAPALQWDAKKVDDIAKSDYSEKDMKAMQAVAANFIIDNIVDSEPTLDFSKKNQSALFERTKDDILPKYVKEWEETTTGQGEDAAEHNVYDFTGSMILSQGAEPAPYLKDEPRLRVDAFSLKSIHGDKDGLYFEYDTKTTREFVKNDNPFLFQLQIGYIIGVTQDDSGEWTVSGWGRTEAGTALVEE